MRNRISVGSKMKISKLMACVTGVNAVDDIVHVVLVGRMTRR